MNAEQLKRLESDLWEAADNLRSNSDLSASEYGTPVLGLIFLKFADINYRRHEAEIKSEHQKRKGTRREKALHEIAVAKCGFHLPKHARYNYLLNLSEDKDIAKAIEDAMKSIEKYKPELADSLPKAEYRRLTRTPATKHLPFDLLRQFDNIPDDAEGDVFGHIYEYFLGKFAMAEGKNGGEFFTPRSVVRLMVEIIEPHGGTVFDPACGSGGMFVQSAQFIASHRQELEARGKDTSVFVYGQEKRDETVKLARMNLAVNGLRGEIKQGISYYEDHFQSLGQFDYVLANPPFNGDDVLLSGVEKDPRFNAYGIPRNKGKAKKSKRGKETVPNANYLWINLFATSLKKADKRSPGGRAALVMANSASDARHSESDIRRALIKSKLIYGMLSLPSNMFYTVTLPATLWFFDKGKKDDRMLFIDARNIFTPIDRVHREFSDEQIQNIAIISRLHKGRRKEFLALVDRYFAAGMKCLAENKALAQSVAEGISQALDDDAVKDAVGGLLRAWKGADALKMAYNGYRKQNGKAAADQKNAEQRRLRAKFNPSFARLHDSLKRVDKTVRQHVKSAAQKPEKAASGKTADRAAHRMKSALESLHEEVKAAEIYFGHIQWLQDRFPKARYEDVTGLCKLASMKEIEEQDYSLNPGRYVGVAIEEDGKTEDEFVGTMLRFDGQLKQLNVSAKRLEKVVSLNTQAIVGEA